MRLLISGSLKNTNTIGAFITQNFDGSFPYEVLQFTDAYSTHLSLRVNRVINYFFPLILIRKMDRLFLKQVEEFKPTVILIFKGMEISDWSLRIIKEKGILLVNYNFDHPFDFFSKGTGNRYVKRAIPFYDLHISYSTVIATQLERVYKVKTAWIPFGFHLTEKQFDDVIDAGLPEINKVCFVGNPDNLRVDMIKKMLADRIPIDLYGFGWNNYLQPHELLVIHGPRKGGSFWIDSLEFWKVLRQYRIQLNFFRPHNEGSHNLRTFEVPAVGGVLLTPASGEQEMFFPKEEVFFYTDYNSLTMQCKHLLMESEDLIARVRKNARARSLIMDYSYGRRTKDLVKLLVDLETRNQSK